jgi:hypothetical protein
MPRRDRYHETVKNALTQDGWTITDPLVLSDTPKGWIQNERVNLLVFQPDTQILQWIDS